MSRFTLSAAALLLSLPAAQAIACDSYYDDMSLAAVLSDAVKEAKAAGTLEPGSSVQASAPQEAAVQPDDAAAPVQTASTAAPVR